MTQKTSVARLVSSSDPLSENNIVWSGSAPVVRLDTGYIQIAGHQLPGTDTHRNNYGNGLYSFVSEE